MSEELELFVGSPRNKYGGHGSKGFKGDYAQAWKVHFSQVGGGATTATAGGPIRGTVRRTEMIAATMKPPCTLPTTEAIGPRKGPKSPLPGSFSEKPSDYGLSEWAKASDDDLTEEDVRLTCSDLEVIKRAALAEVKRRAEDREDKDESLAAFFAEIGRLEAISETLSKGGDPTPCGCGTGPEEVREMAFMLNLSEPRRVKAVTGSLPKGFTLSKAPSKKGGLHSCSLRADDGPCLASCAATTDLRLSLSERCPGCPVRDETKLKEGPSMPEDSTETPGGDEVTLQSVLDELSALKEDVASRLAALEAEVAEIKNAEGEAPPAEEPPAEEGFNAGGTPLTIEAMKETLSALLDERLRVPEPEPDTGSRKGEESAEEPPLTHTGGVAPPPSNAAPPTWQERVVADLKAKSNAALVGGDPNARAAATKAVADTIAMLEKDAT